jgi:hypothetical protein
VEGAQTMMISSFEGKSARLYGPSTEPTMAVWQIVPDHELFKFFVDEENCTLLASHGPYRIIC